MGVAFNLIVVCAAWSLCGAYRSSSIRAIQSKQTAVCARKAVVSEDDTDVRSLSFDDPDFSFFESRSFFLSKNSSCEIRMPEVKLQMVPTTAEGKLALLEQRLKVKHLKDGLRSVVKADVGSLQGMRNLVKGPSGDHKVVPAVELHMFPIDPMNVSSTWQVLLVPTVQEVFGERLYLCNPNSVDPCVAELPFEDLPWRLRRVFSRKWWDPVLDQRRSTPMWLVWIAELLLLCAACVASASAAAAVYKLIDGLLTTEDADPNRDAILEDQKKLPGLLPYQLLKHAYVYRCPGGSELVEPKVCKDAGEEVLVDMIESASQTISCSNFSFESLWEGIRRIYAKPKEALWGRLQKDDAWILLHKEKEKWPFVIAAGKKPLAQFEASPDLLPQFGHWARRILVLFASYTTALWVSVDHLTELCSVPVLVCLLLGMFLIHGTVLLEEIHAWWLALSYDEVLKVRRELLRLPGVNIFSASVCGLLCGMVFVGLLVKLPTAERSQRPAFLLLLVSAALHARHFYRTMVSRRLWREPKLLNKESFYVELDTLSSTSTWPMKLSIQRAKAYFLVASLVALALSGAAMVVSFAVLDIMEMRGELLDYSFSRGHLTSPASTFSFHNTVLLEDKTDSLTLNFEKGNHTRGLFLQVENPLLDNSSETIPVHQVTEQAIPLPSSPFYSRIKLLAVGSYIDTTYIFHILRLGTAINVSLQSFFGAKHPELQSQNFSEERRIQYLSENGKWYIPDVDVDMNSTMKVKMEPIALAPLRASTDTHLPQVSKSCHCEKTVPGEGDRCVFQQVMRMSGEQICIYQRQLQRLEPDLTSAGVAGQNFGAVQWLKDVNSSGKSVTLELNGTRLGFAPNHDGNDHNHSNTFALTAPLKEMARAAQLLVTTTPDPTDTEAMATPLEFVFHAPPVSLKLPSSSNFLLPKNEQDSQGLYAWCGGDEVDTVTGEVEDLRFQVEANIIHYEQSCTGSHTDSRKEFRVYYNKTNPYCGSKCHTYPYIPRYNDYDLAVTWSARECLHKAVVYDNVTALDHTIKTMAPEDPEAKKCLDEGGLLRVAIRRGQHNFAQRIIEKGANLSAVTEGETPLIAASVLGDIAGVELLLNVNDSSLRRQIDLRVEGETALSTAILYCHADVVGALLDHGSSVTGETCQEVPLVGLLSFPKLVKCNGSQLQDVLHELKRYNATLNATVDGDCRGDALRDSAENKDLAAMKFVLEQGVNMSEDLGIEAVESVVQKSLDEKWPQSDVKSVIDLMKEYGADLNRVKEPPTLIQVADECDVKLFQTLQELGANASATWDGQNPITTAQKKCKDKICTNDTCPEEYIGQNVSQAIANLAQQ